VVQAQDEAGNILAQSTAVLQGKDVGVGGQGDWSVELNLEDVIPGTKGAIVAFSTKPASDGSSQRVAETRVDVLYGEKVEAMIVIREPSHGMVLDIDQPVEVKGQGQGLPEANVVVQALDASGNVLAQEATTLQGKKVGVGGKGDWAVALDLSQVTPGVRGRIVAFGTDPNGGRVAETGIDVTFGEAVEPTPEPTEEPVDPSEALEGRKWEMVNPLPDTEITLMFVRGKVTGFAGCNDFTGSYQTSSSGSIKIGDLKTGRRACEQPIMDQEKQFLASLGQATAFQVVEDQMTLNTPNGLLQFQTEDD
jgi:heat shock protein HslJ